MQVVLLERVEKLGQMGDIVTVKDGFARNFLLPRGKALRATKDNMAHFEQERAQLEARNLEMRGEAQQVGEKLEGTTFVVIRQSSDAGMLYGSVSARDVGAELEGLGFTVHRSQIVLDKPIKSLGLHEIRVVLHPEVTSTVTANVARSDEEAERQARGEDVTAKTDDDDDFDLDAAEIFEEGAETNTDEEADGTDADASQTDSDDEDTSKDN